MGNGNNLLLGRFQLDIRGKLLTMRTISHWDCLSREMVGFPTLLTFMTQLERVQCHLVQNLFLPRLNQMILEVSFHPGILWLDDSKCIFGVNIYCWLLMDWRFSPTTFTPLLKIPGWVNTSLGASRALRWRTGPATPLRHFIRVAVLLLENNLTKHCEVWVSGNTSTHF